MQTILQNTLFNKYIYTNWVCVTWTVVHLLIFKVEIFTTELNTSWHYVVLLTGIGQTVTCHFNIFQRMGNTNVPKIEYFNMHFRQSLNFTRIFIWHTLQYNYMRCANRVWNVNNSLNTAFIMACCIQTLTVFIDWTILI